MERERIVGIEEKVIGEWIEKRINKKIKEK